MKGHPKKIAIVDRELACRYAANVAACIAAGLAAGRAGWAIFVDAKHAAAASSHQTNAPLKLTAPPLEVILCPLSNAPRGMTEGTVSSLPAYA
jgi:hypothetical protein